VNKTKKARILCCKIVINSSQNSSWISLEINVSRANFKFDIWPALLPCCCLFWNISVFYHMAFFGEFYIFLSDFWVTFEWLLSDFWVTFEWHWVTFESWVIYWVTFESFIEWLSTETEIWFLKKKVSKITKIYFSRAKY
jgi:hypothetical protein